MNQIGQSPPCKGKTPNVGADMIPVNENIMWSWFPNLFLASKKKPNKKRSYCNRPVVKSCHLH